MRRNGGAHIIVHTLLHDMGRRANALILHLLIFYDRIFSFYRCCVLPTVAGFLFVFTITSMGILRYLAAVVCT